MSFAFGVSSLNFAVYVSLKIITLMAIRVKKEKITLNFKKEKPTSYKLSQVKEQVVSYKALCRNVAANTGIRKGEVEDVLESIAQQAKQMMEMGHAVQLGILGTLKPVIQAKCAKSMNDLNVNDNIVRLKVRFYPGEVFKDLLSEMDIETEADEDEGSSPSGGSTDGGNDGGGSSGDDDEYT